MAQISAPYNIIIAPSRGVMSVERKLSKTPYYSPWFRPESENLDFGKISNFNFNFSCGKNRQNECYKERIQHRVTCSNLYKTKKY